MSDDTVIIQQKRRDSRLRLLFIKKFDLPFRLIADIDKKVINSFGVWGPKKFMGVEFDGIIRTTFVISEKGIIERIFNKVETKNHTEQILETYK